MGSFERKLKRNMVKKAIREKGYNPNEKIRTKDKEVKSRLSDFMDHMKKHERKSNND